MPRPLKYWIKERHNPQLGVYWVPCGQLTKAQANEMEECLYGTNYMHRFDSKSDYDAKLIQLELEGSKVQE